MSLKSRSTSPSLRGSGGGGGKITVNDHTGEAISTGVRTIEWQTLDPFGFTVSVDPDDETRVIVGLAPEFLDPIQWSSNQTVDVRVSESEPTAGDAFLTDGKEGTILKGTLRDFIYTSTVGRGFGPESSLSVKTFHAGTLVDDLTFPCIGNGSSTQGNVTVIISDYAPDGDGSVFQGKLRIIVGPNGVIGSGRSGVCRVEIKFLEQKFAETQSISQDVFRDSGIGEPDIIGGRYALVGRELDERVLKYLSGIAYYDIGTAYELSVGGFKRHNNDSSKPTGSVSFELGSLGINPYTATPFLQPTEFVSYNNKHNLSTFNYYELRQLDRTNFRHIGNGNFTVNASDSWNTSADYDSNILKLCIDTVDNPSTDLVEYFDAENMRLASDYTAAWNSARYCLDGEAIVYGGSLYHGSDLPRILENTVGTLGTAGSLTNNLPNEDAAGLSRQNPNYTGHTKEAVFLRKFIAPSATDEYAGMNLTVACDGELSTKLANGDIKIYIWKIDSSDPTSVNKQIPPSYSTVNQSSSLVNSVWAHKDYNFLSFDDGASGTEGGSGCISKLTGNILDLTFGGFNVVEGVLVRLQIKKGTRLDEVSATFK